MPSVRNLATVLLLAGTSLGVPFFSGVTKEVVVRDGGAPCSPLPCVANRIMYAIQTVTIPYGSTSSPTAVSPDSVVAPGATTSSVADSPAATQAPASAPVPASSAAPSASATATPPSSNVAPSTGSLTAETILKIMPKSGSCASPRDKIPGNCRTATEAAGPLQKGFDKWTITVKGAQAANLALIAFESDQMMYKVSASDPPTPGKGTYAVMMPPNVKLYATALKGEAAVNAAGSDVAILDLVNKNDDDAFGAASWYMATQCPGTQEKFNGDVDAAFTYYINECVHGGDMDKRQATWVNAKKAFGLT